MPSYYNGNQIEAQKLAFWSVNAAKSTIEDFNQFIWAMPTKPIIANDVIVVHHGCYYLSQIIDYKVPTSKILVLSFRTRFYRAHSVAFDHVIIILSITISFDLFRMGHSKMDSWFWGGVFCPLLFTFNYHQKSTITTGYTSNMPKPNIETRKISDGIHDFTFVCCHAKFKLSLSIFTTWLHWTKNFFALQHQRSFYTLGKKKITFQLVVCFTHNKEYKCAI